MRRGFLIPIALCLLTAAIPAHPQDEGDTPPVQVDVTERAEVRLVLLDTIVVDKDGNPVADLTKEDFEIRHDGKAVTPDVLETRCDRNELQVETAQRRGPRDSQSPEGSATRRIVLAFDYLHLQTLERERALDTAMQMVEKDITAGDEVMVAALTGGLRVEQPFTTDAGEVLASLKRMQKDISLWNGNFGHQNEFGFVRGVTSLFDVLATASVGPKAVVLYSAMADVPMDNQFELIAAVAATSRCALYTVDPFGLKPPDRSPDVGTGALRNDRPG